MMSSLRLPSLLVCALAFLLGAESVAAKCPNPLRVDGVVTGAVVIDGALAGSLADFDDVFLPEQLDPDDIHSIEIRCWTESTAQDARGLAVFVVMTKDYAAALGDVTVDEGVAAMLAKADPAIRELWEELTP